MKEIDHKRNTSQTPSRGARQLSPAMVGKRTPTMSVARSGAVQRKPLPSPDSETPRDPTQSASEPAMSFGDAVFGPAMGARPVQRAADASGRGPSQAVVHEAAARGVASPSTTLPHADAIQRSFGHHDISGIEAHQGNAASQSASDMGAAAFATGHHVVLGQSADLHTVAHEAAHIVQQRGGVQLKGGVGETGDVHEQHADKVADKVVAGESAETLLDEYAGTGSSPGSEVQRLTSKVNQDLLALGDFYHLAAAGLLNNSLNINYSGSDDTKKAQIDRFFQQVVGAQYQETQTKSRNSSKATGIVAKAFQKADSQVDLHDTIRAAFLNDVPDEAKAAIEAFLAEQLDENPDGGAQGDGSGDAGGDAPVIPPKVLIWIRQNADHGDNRNTTPTLIQLMLESATGAGLVPILIGDATPDAAQQAVEDHDARNLTQFWKADGGALFGGPDNIQKQLSMLDTLRQKHGVVAQIGVKSGAMDGPALMGLPTLVLDVEPDPEKQRRMAQWGNTMSCYHVFYPNEGKKNLATPGDEKNTDKEDVGDIDALKNQLIALLASAKA